MKILYLHQYFKTPEEGGAIRSYYVASKMVEEGHSVDLVTSHNKLEYLIKRVNGVRVHYLPIKYDNKFGKVKRILSFLWFGWKALKIAKKLKSELCYATSTPLTIGWIALRLNSILGTPFIFEVRDLWPEAPKQLGVIKNKLILFLAERLEKRIYFRADKIIALSPGMEDGIRKIVGKDKIEVISNFGNKALYKSLEASSVSSSTNFTLVYTGALGEVNNIPLLEKVISSISNLKNVELKIAGDGKYARFIQEKCKENKNTHFLGQLNKVETYELLSSSDAFLITFLDFPVLETNSPNKFFDGIACKSVPLVNNKGWIKDLIEEHDCGFHFTIDNIAVLVQLLRDDSDLVSRYKKNSENLSTSFDKSNQCAKICALIETTFHNSMAVENYSKSI